MLIGILYQMQHHPLRFACVTLALTLLPVWLLTGDFSPLP